MSHVLRAASAVTSRHLSRSRSARREVVVPCFDSRLLVIGTSDTGKQPRRVSHVPFFFFSLSLSFSAFGPQSNDGFGVLFIFLGIMCAVFLGIVYVSYEQYNRSKYMSAAQSQF